MFAAVHARSFSHSQRSAFTLPIPPLLNEERALLRQNLLSEGCRDALVVWKGHDVLLDGHNRYDICTELGLPF